MFILFKMITAHFYESDTVAAQLMHSLCSGDTDMAHKTASELALSDDALLFRILCLAWWLMPPDHLLQGARAAAFLSSNNHALFSSLVGYAFDLPQCLTCAVAAKPASRETIQKAIKKRRSDDLYNALSTLSYSELSNYIQKPFIDAMASTVYKPLEQRILMHAAAALLSRLSSAAPTLAFVSHPHGIAGRTFHISKEACAVWNVRVSPCEALRGDPHKLIQAKLFETEDDEIVYLQYFPDDIPDEWSEEEVNKSHGIIISEFIKNPWKTAFFDML